VGDFAADAAVTTRDESDAVYLQSEQSQSQPDSQQSQSQAIETSFWMTVSLAVYIDECQ
jgi:hypothetical protein